MRSASSSTRGSCPPKSKAKNKAVGFAFFRNLYFAISSSVVFVGGRDFQDGEEGFLGDVHLAYAFHAALAFFLFFEELAFAGDVAAVALGQYVFAHSGHGFAGDDAAADGGLDGHFKHLARDEFAAAFVRSIAMRDHGESVHRFATDENVEFHEVGFLVASKMVVEGSISARDGLQAIVKIEDNFIERQLVSEHDSGGREIFEVFLGAPFILAELKNAADGLIVSDDHSLDDGLFDFFHVTGRRKFCGAIHFNDVAADASDAITHAGRGGDEVEAELALQAFLHDFHVQQAEEATAEAETEGNGVFRFVEKGRVVELKFAESVAQRLVIVGEDGEQAGEDHGLGGFKSGKRGSRAAGFDDGVAHAGVSDAFDVGDDKADVAGFEFLESDRLGSERAELFDFVNLVVGAETNLHVVGDAAFHQTNQHDRAAVNVKPGIEDERLQRILRAALGSGNAMDNGFEDVFYAEAAFGADE